MGSRAPKRAFPKDRAQRLCGAGAKANAREQTVPPALYKKELMQERGGREISLPPFSCALRLSAKRAASRTPGAILRGMAGAFKNTWRPGAQVGAAFRPGLSRTPPLPCASVSGRARRGKGPFLAGPPHRALCPLLLQSFAPKRRQGEKISQSGQGWKALSGGVSRSSTRGFGMTTVAFAGTSSTTTQPAPMRALSPTMTRPMILAPAPI